MNTTRYAILTLALGIAAASIETRAQGPLAPPGPPGKTMKSLSQIEPRSPITNSSAVVIGVPGSYYLTTNITVTSGDAINITANGVTLDLNGFTIRSTDPTAGGYGIKLASELSDIAVLNGFIRGGVTNNGKGKYSGPGFYAGILYSGNQPSNVRVSGVSVSGCKMFGIYVGLTGSTLVESCTVKTFDATGIVASTARGCVATDCRLTGIWCVNASDCRAESVTNNAIDAKIAENCWGLSRYGIGVDVFGTARDCAGTSSSGIGLYAWGAVNCQGTSSNNTALHVYQGAENCYGESVNGTGLIAKNAQNCWGYSKSHVGLQADTAVGCKGKTDGAIFGLKANVADTCEGISAGSWGLYAYAANNCTGQSTSGGGLYAGRAMNCVGMSTSGGGLQAVNANNCVGSSATGTGLDANGGVAIGCYGSSSSGTGLVARIANSCVGVGSVSMVVNNKYDMP